MISEIVTDLITLEELAWAESTTYLRAQYLRQYDERFRAGPRQSEIQKLLSSCAWLGLSFRRTRQIAGRHLVVEMKDSRP